VNKESIQEVKIFMNKIRTAILVLILLCAIFILIGCIGASPLSRGGLIYDKWWEFTKVEEPTVDHPLWITQSTNTRSGGTTWRCKECHGWDYKGEQGAYSSGSHYTGFSGVYESFVKMSEDELVGVLKGSTNPDHDFSSVMSDKSISDLAVFLKEGIIDMSLYINYDDKTVINADLNNGEKIYKRSCKMCHDNDGKKKNFGTEEKPVFVGNVANSNPWETLHKIQFGQPGSNMYSLVDFETEIQDAVDVLAYAQTLNKE
jgi:thiosulfate dehydrogenase